MTMPPPSTDDAPQPTAAPSPPPAPREMPCPNCGHLMPDLKGGKASICPNCGFKDSCCY
jgi:DNA-directed RNA polymerase subunit RPC12/RpoP